MIRRHPSRIRLAAWFDGEAERTIGDHVRDCARCRAYVQGLTKVRAIVRDEEPAPAFTSAHRRPAAVVAIAACVAVLVAFSAAWATPLRQHVQDVLGIFGSSPTHHLAQRATSAPTHGAQVTPHGSSVIAPRSKKAP